MSVFSASRGSVPRSTPHLLADYIELEALFGDLQTVSITDIATLLNEGVELGDEDLPVVDVRFSTAEFNDVTLRYAEEAMRHVEYRAQAFGKFYPLVKSGAVFKRVAQINEKQTFYVFLLVCSRLGILAARSGLRQRFAAFFEGVSAEALRLLFPGMTVRQFGPGSTDRVRYYGATLRDALTKLGRDLRTQAAVEPIAPGNFGDRGIDVIGYKEWPDKANGLFAIFAQCAARNIDWPKKALESSPAVHRGVLNLRHDPVNVLFVPVCFREPSGDWIDPGYPWSVVLIDRLRLIRIADRSRALRRKVAKAAIVVNVLKSKF